MYIQELHGGRTSYGDVNVGLHISAESSASCIQIELHTNNDTFCALMATNGSQFCPPPTSS